MVFLRYYWVTLRLNMQKVMDKVSAYFGDGIQGEDENRGMNIYGLVNIVLFCMKVPYMLA